MQKNKLVRGILIHNGLDTQSELDAVRMVSGTTDGKVYFYDVEGDYVYATWNTTTPVIVDSNTTGITVAPASPALYNSGTQQQLTVTNQNGDDVTFECTFLSNNTGLTTVSAGGLLTATSIAGITGTTTVKVTHPDIPTLTGSSFVTIRRTTTSITLTGNTTLDAYTVLDGGIRVYNQLNTLVTTKCAFTSGTPTTATINAATGYMTILRTGTTMITAVHADGATGETLVTVTGSVISSMGAYSGATLSTGGTFLTGETFYLIFKDQAGNNITPYVTLTTNPYINSFNPTTGAVYVYRYTGTTSATFNYALRSVTTNYQLIIS